MSVCHTLLQLPLAGFWFGEPATTNAENVDSLFGIITWICIAFFILIVGLMAVFLVRYRHRDGHAELPSPSHNNSLEIIWSVIPILLVALIFFLGFTAFMDMRTPPADSYDIQVLASKWKFLFRYPNGAESEVLHIPPDRPVRLVQQSADVLHSLYIPAFRTKMDCVPGRYTYQWFNANKPGDYDLFCAEYCGLDHSNMNSIVRVHESQAAFDLQLKKLNVPPAYPPDWGRELWERKGCKQCHSIDGSERPGGGPSWDDLWGTERQIMNASPVIADENYIKESIRMPQAKIRTGYQGINMSAYPPSLVSDAEIDALIAFMKELAGKYDGPSREEAEAAAKAAAEEGVGADSAAAANADATPANEKPAAEETKAEETTGKEPEGTASDSADSGDQEQ